MHSDFGFLFERAGEVPGSDPVWQSISAQVRDVFGAGEFSPARSVALCSLVLANCADADHRLAEFGARQARLLAQCSRDEPAARMAMRALVECARADGRNESALRFVRELQTLGDRAAIADEIELLELMDEVTLARELLEHALDRSRGDGCGWTNSRLAVAALRHDYAFGSLADARKTAQHIVDGAIADHAGDGALEARVILGRVAQLSGDYALARQHLAVAQPRACRGDEWPALLLLTRASLASCEGDAAGALDIFGALVRRTRASGCLRCWLPSWLVEAARLAIDCGEAETARDVADIARAVHAGTASSVTSEAVAAQTAGLVSRDVALLEKAVKLAQQSPRAFVFADASLDYGRALFAEDRKIDAIAALDAAWDAFRSIGARGPAILIERQLVRAGVRRRKWSADPNRPLAGWGALTATERRVARLIGEGHTSNAAAAMLGSAPNTVRAQVRSIFAKLGITSRVHLARMVTNEA